MAKRNHAKGSISYPFIAIPTALLRSPAWGAMTHRSRVLMFDLAAQYTGGNNGRLTPSFEAMRQRGWTSRDQLGKAKAELLACSFAIETRKGRPPRTASWIGFTWWRLHWHESMEIEPTAWPLMNFVAIEDAQIDPNEGRAKLNGKTVSVSRRAGRWTPKTPSSLPPCGPMEASR